MIVTYHYQDDRELTGYEIVERLTNVNAKMSRLSGVMVVVWVGGKWNDLKTGECHNDLPSQPPYLL